MPNNSCNNSQNDPSYYIINLIFYRKLWAFTGTSTKTIYFCSFTNSILLLYTPKESSNNASSILHNTNLNKAHKVYKYFTLRFWREIARSERHQTEVYFWKFKILFLHTFMWFVSLYLWMNPFQFDSTIHVFYIDISLNSCCYGRSITQNNPIIGCNDVWGT